MTAKRPLPASATQPPFNSARGCARHVTWFSVIIPEEGSNIGPVACHEGSGELYGQPGRAGRGIGRSTAVLLAREGASVVVNDLGGAVDGSGSDTGPAYDVVSEITSAGGKAIANGADGADHAA